MKPNLTNSVRFIAVIFIIVASASQYALAREVVLQDNKLLVAFDTDTGALIRMENKSTHWVIERRPELGASFRLFVPLSNRRYNFVLGQKQHAVKVEKISDHEVQIEWKNIISEHGGVLPITLTVTVTLQNGAFPHWGVPNLDSGVMMGDPAAPIISDFYAFGARDFDTKDALAGLVRAATDTTVRAPRTNTYERDALADYLKLGYVPEHQKGGYGNVSMTLEYASADFALSQFAKALGDESDYKLLLNHAQNWKNHFNPETGFSPDEKERRLLGTWCCRQSSNL